MGNLLGTVGKLFTGTFKNGGNAAKVGKLIEKGKSCVAFERNVNGHTFCYKKKDRE